MAEAKNQITPEEAAMNKAGDFARAEARRALVAERKKNELLGVEVPVESLPEFIAPVTPITQAQVDARNKHILDSLMPGEPIFIFRAKDILSTMVLQQYASLLETYSPYAEIMEATVQKINDFRDWQHANPSAVKLPD